MARRRTGPYFVGDLVFKTQKEAIEHIRVLLHRTPLGQALDEEDTATILSLLQSHPNRDAKIGVGVAAIRVQMDSEWRTTRQFAIVRTDGTSTDFSFKECLAPASRLQLFKRACRDAVADQTQSFREAELKRLSSPVFTCPVLGISVDSDQIHVDHKPPWTFDRLVTDFIERECVDVNAIKLTGFGDNEMRKGFEDVSIRDRWQEFHRVNARLRLVCKKANLSDIRRSASAGTVDI